MLSCAAPIGDPQLEAGRSVLVAHVVVAFAPSVEASSEPALDNVRGQDVEYLLRERCGPPPCVLSDHLHSFEGPSFAVGLPPIIPPRTKHAVGVVGIRRRPKPLFQRRRGFRLLGDAQKANEDRTNACLPSAEVSALLSQDDLTTYEESRALQICRARISANFCLVEKRCRSVDHRWFNSFRCGASRSSKDVPAFSR